MLKFMGEIHVILAVYCLLLQARRHDHMSVVLAALDVTGTGYSSDVSLVPHDK
jgi:hypothetical protein